MQYQNTTGFIAKSKKDPQDDSKENKKERIKKPLQKACLYDATKNCNKHD